jgi:hypothetical protein
LASQSDATLSALIGFEYGNELLDSGSNPSVDPTVYAEDMHVLRGLIDQIWKSHGRAYVPFLVGPASNLAQVVPFMLGLKPGKKEEGEQGPEEKVTWTEERGRTGTTRKGKEG